MSSLGGQTVFARTQAGLCVGTMMLAVSCRCMVGEHDFEEEMMAYARIRLRDSRYEKYEDKSKRMERVVGSSNVESDAA